MTSIRSFFCCSGTRSAEENNRRRAREMDNMDDNQFHQSRDAQRSADRIGVDTARPPESPIYGASQAFSNLEHRPNRGRADIAERPVPAGEALHAGGMDRAAAAVGADADVAASGASVGVYGSAPARAGMHAEPLESRRRTRDALDGAADGKGMSGPGWGALAATGTLATLLGGGVAGLLFGLSHSPEKPVVPDFLSPDNPAGPITAQLLSAKDHPDLNLDSAVLADRHGHTGTALDVGDSGFAAGRWTLTVKKDAADAARNGLFITFTPKQADDTTQPDIVYYRVEGSNALVSNLARILVSYDAQIQPGGPVAHPIQRTPSTRDVTIQTLQSVTPDGFDIDPASIEIATTAAGFFSNSLDVEGEGRWTVDPASGTIAFKADPALMVNPTAIFYRAADTTGARTAAKPITIRYAFLTTPRDMPFDGPLAQNIVIGTYDYDTDGVPLPGGGAARGVEVNVPDFVLPKEGQRLDPASVLLFATLTPTDDLPRAARFDGAVRDETGDIVGFSSVQIAGEGAWNVTPRGTVVFVPEAGFDGQPTGLYYTVADGSGHRSNAALILLSRAVGNGRQALLDLASQDADAFWQGYRQMVDAADINDLADLSRIYALTALSEAMLYQQMDPQAAARAAQLRPETLPQDILAGWSLSGLPADLYDLAESYARGLGLTDDAQGILDRYVRLNLMRRIWPLFFAKLYKMMNGNGHNDNGRG